MRHRRRHIGDAIMHDATQHIGRITVSGGTSGLNAAALIDGDVNDDGTFLHGGNHRFGDNLGCGSARDQHAADEKVRLASSMADVVGVGSESVDAAVEDIVQFAQAVQVHVDDGDFRAHAERDFGGVDANNAAADDADIPIGTVSIEGDTLTVSTLHGTQQIPVKNIAFIIDQATFEKNVFKRQGLTQGITGTVSAGASTVNSTQNSVSINTGVVLSRVVPPVTWMPARQRTLLNFNSNYGKVTQPNTPTVKTNILHGAIEEDEYFSPRFYLLEQATYDHNFSQGLDLQQLYGIGAGYTVIKDAQQELDLTAIMDYTKQQFSASGVTPATSTNLVGSSFGDNYVRNFPRKIVLTEIALFNPAWNTPADYSANVSVGATFPVFKNFGFSVGVIDSYLNDPPAGFLGNSVQFNTGLTYMIQH